MKNNNSQKKQDEIILKIAIEAGQYLQLQAKIEQLKQDKKPCFSLVDVALIALALVFFKE